MEKYRKVQIIGKGSFGHAVLVQSIQDRKPYVMKVKTFGILDIDNRCVKNGQKTKGRRSQRSNKSIPKA